LPDPKSGVSVRDPAGLFWSDEAQIKIGAHEEVTAARAFATSATHHAMMTRRTFYR
jgi:hypothetical protein